MSDDLPAGVVTKVERSEFFVLQGWTVEYPVDGADGAISQRPTSGDQGSAESCSGDGVAGAEPAGATAPINQPLVVMEHWSTCPHTGRRVRQEISW